MSTFKSLHQSLGLQKSRRKNNFYSSVFFIFIFFSSISTNFAQHSFEIEGKIINKTTREPLDYANVFNKSIKQGTISNIDGYFRILADSFEDSIQISFIGYTELTLNLKLNQLFYTIYLEENEHLLSEITITPEDDLYLYDLIQKCRKSADKIKTQTNAKAYFELKSFIDQNQVELVEGYYNAGIQGNKLEDLELKNGRIALQPNKNRFFISLESSKAMTMLDLHHENEYFPKNPLEFSKSKLKKNYYLSLHNIYLDNKSDSIYVIEFAPKKNTGQFFSGKMWVNKTNENVLKITLNCKNALKHPFLPLFRADSILKVNIEITKSFNHQALFNHIDFVYEIDYKSRYGIAEERNYTIKTNAVLYVYEYHHTFQFPIFDFSSKSVGDYRKINALPYNDFFWENNAEYRLNDSLNANKQFFSDAKSLTNKSLFTSSVYFDHGLLEHLYVGWSKNRIKFREIIADSIENPNTKRFISEQYKLVINTYLDINFTKDSTHIITSVILDPYESYYRLPMDNKTHCFVNIYFDLCEISRRRLDKKLKNGSINGSKINEIYDEYLAAFEYQKTLYLKETERGTNEKSMKEYNAYVLEHLGIDNIAMIKPFNSEK